MRSVGISKQVNILTELTMAQIQKGSWLCAILAYTYISPGSSQAQVMIKNLTSQSVTVSKGHMIGVIRPGNEVPKMLAPKQVNEKDKSYPEAGHHKGKPEEGPRGGSHVYLKQSVGRPMEWKPLIEDQLKELHEKLQCEEHVAGWESELK